MESNGDPGALGGGDLITVGQITRAHGCSGEVRVKVLTDFPDRFQEDCEMTLTRTDGLRQKVKITGARSVDKGILLRLDGVDNRSAAKRLAGACLQIQRSQLRPLPADSYYFFQIVGLEVVNEKGEPLGKVTEILRTPANDVYVVCGEKEVMVPALRSCVVSIDLASGRMVVRREAI